MRLAAARPRAPARPLGRRPLLAVLALLVVAGLVLVAALRLEAVNRAAAERARSDAFYGRLYGFEAVGPIPTSLAEIGRTSQAVVLGRFDGRVEPGRVVVASDIDPRYDAYFANVGFRIEAILAGNLPAADADDLLIEYLVAGPEEIRALAGTLPTERSVLFVGSKYLRARGIPTVYYEVGLGRGTFRELDGRTAPVGLTTDPQFGRLEGLPFTDFIDLVRQIPILDEMPAG
ncbi:MAG TPA: hypothetical protein VNO86_09605 [Candidatus Binatia bacterium]|nr:hypothetical protein [Candidatus Binatia bacterium]